MNDQYKGKIYTLNEKGEWTSLEDPDLVIGKATIIKWTPKTNTITTKDDDE